MSLRHLLGRARDRLLTPARLAAAQEVLDWRLRDLDRRVRAMQEALGRIEARQIANRDGVPIAEAEFRVWSQWGEDGIVQHLVRRVPVRERSFVEFGVENYEEANTRFLLVHDGWRGLVMDGDAHGIRRIREQREYWRHDLTAVQAFVTRENVDALLREHGFAGELGLLSIDIDGMDYWVWEGIESASPAIVVIEYNARLGAEEALVVPYDPAFDRRRAHHSLLYYGASLKALELLGRRKGYDLVACGRAGLNAFFVRRDLRPASLPARTAEEAYVPAVFCEAHDAEGRRVKLSDAEQRRLLRTLPLVRVDADGRATAVPPGAERGHEA